MIGTRALARLLNRCASAASVLGLCVACAVAPAQSPPLMPGAAPTIEQVIVKFKSPQLQAQPAEALQAEAAALSARARLALLPLRNLSGGAHLFKLERSLPLEQAQQLCAELARDPAVDYAEPDAKMRIQRPAAPARP